MNTGDQPIVPLSLFVSASAKSTEFYPTYSANIFSSLNLSPIHKAPHLLAAPYSRVQEYPRVFVVLETKKGSQTILITEAEERDLKSFSARIALRVILKKEN